MYLTMRSALAVEPRCRRPGSWRGFHPKCSRGPWVQELRLKVRPPTVVSFGCLGPWGKPFLAMFKCVHKIIQVSMVDMASPAPFTMHATLPSSVQCRAIPNPPMSSFIWSWYSIRMVESRYITGGSHSTFTCYKMIYTYTHVMNQRHIG